MGIKNIIKTVSQKMLRSVHYEQDKALMLLGGLNAQNVKAKKEINSLADVEFKVYSQWGEDGIIQFLINHMEIPHKIFIEFGVQDYTESNTRFLLKHDNWSGLVLDGAKENIDYIRQDDIYWRYDIKAVEAFITKENINQLISDYTDQKDIGLLSVDIDGNDYWIWDAVTVINPRIVVCEYNSLFGPDQDVSIPYRDDFYRTSAHYSNIYYGVSIKALERLGEEKGYLFIGTNQAGNNAFFIRKDVPRTFDFSQLDKRFRTAKFNECRNEDGGLLFIDTKAKLGLIKEQEIFDFSSGTIRTVESLLIQ